MSAPIASVLDRVARVTPFGAQFWDAATRRYIGEGLQLRAVRQGGSNARPVDGFANRSGVYLLDGLPGMRDIENGDGDEAFWARETRPASPPRNAFRVEVTDRARRFLPYWFDASLPVRGLFPASWPDTGLPASPPQGQALRLPLFSAPSRPVPGAFAVVRAELRDAGRGEPAAWALVRARYGPDVVCTALADRDGRVTMIFAYPEPRPKHLDRSSPSLATGGPTWNISLDAFYLRRYAERANVPEIESLHEIAAQWNYPRRLLEPGSPATELGELQLTARGEHVVRSPGSPYLFIECP